MTDETRTGENPFLKYENKDERCTYPFSPDPAGYCWSYAHHVDGKGHCPDMSTICPECELWDAVDALREARREGR